MLLTFPLTAEDFCTVLYKYIKYSIVRLTMLSGGLGDSPEMGVYCKISAKVIHLGYY